MGSSPSDLFGSGRVVPTTADMGAGASRVKRVRDFTRIPFLH